MAEPFERVAGLAVYRRSAGPQTAGAAVAGPGERTGSTRPGATRTPPVVLVHGSMDRGAGFLKVARRLRHLDVVRYDRRGYGRSVEAGVAAGIDGHVEDLEAVIGDQPSIVVGHSFGAVLALAAATRRPDLVRAVGAFEPPTPWHPSWPDSSAGGQAVRAFAEGGAEAAAERFVRAIVGDERWEKLPPSTRRARRAEGRALLAEIEAMRSATGPPFAADELPVPALIGYGNRSAARHVDASQRLAAELTATDPFVIDGAPHGAHTSHPTEFARFVEASVARAGEER